MPEGGLIPKNMYVSLSDEDVNRDRSVTSFLEDRNIVAPEANYLTAYVVRDFPHEVLSHVVILLCYSNKL